MTEFIGKYQLTPYLRIFPIWKHGPIYDPIDGRYVRDGWYPERYGTWKTTAPKETS